MCLKIFYDNKCNICSKEIQFYKKRNIKSIEWIGIHNNTEKLNKANISKESSLKEIHIIDENNNVYKGVDAFIVLWKNFKYFRYLAIIINFYPIKILAKFAYKIFAKYRFKKLYKFN